jgi:hypothetical protein
MNASDTRLANFSVRLRWSKFYMSHPYLHLFAAYPVKTNSSSLQEPTVNPKPPIVPRPLCPSFPSRFSVFVSRPHQGFLVLSPSGEDKRPSFSPQPTLPPKTPDTAALLSWLRLALSCSEHLTSTATAALPVTGCATAQLISASGGRPVGGHCLTVKSP